VAQFIFEGRCDPLGAGPNDAEEARRSPGSLASLLLVADDADQLPIAPRRLGHGPILGGPGIRHQSRIPTAIPRRQSGFPDWRAPAASLTIPGRASLRDTRSSTG